MSYNIDPFKIKKLDNLVIPVQSLFKCEQEDWHPKKTNNDDGTVTFEIMESEITGTIKNNILFVDVFTCSGEGSGTVMQDVLEPALKDSKGELIASCIWEGGDSINQLIVKDGNVSWKDIDI